MTVLYSNQRGHTYVKSRLHDSRCAYSARRKLGPTVVYMNSY